MIGGSSQSSNRCRNESRSDRIMAFHQISKPVNGPDADAMRFKFFPQTMDIDLDIVGADLTIPFADLGSGGYFQASNSIITGKKF